MFINSYCAFKSIMRIKCDYKDDDSSDDLLRFWEQQFKSQFMDWKREIFFLNTNNSDMFKSL